MKVLLFTNTEKSLTSQVLRSVCDWLEGRGIDYELFSSGIFEEKDTRFDEWHASIGEFDLVCSFGGDGTTLRAARLVGISGVPLLSYNLGRLGFLSGAGRADLVPALEAAVDGKLDYDPRALLSATVTYASGRTDHQIALNEVVVFRGHFGRIVALDLSINGTFIDTMKGDGVLVATPTGSTAYSLSAGGPIIAPAHEGLCVVPISPHSLTTRAVITAKDDIVRLEPNSQNRQQLVLSVDGEVFWTHPEGTQRDGSFVSSGGFMQEHSFNDTKEPSLCVPVTAAALPPSDEIISVEVSVCAKKLLFARYGAYDFYDHIARTFFRGDHA
jgi:NAD+ kinase